MRSYAMGKGWVCLLGRATVLPLAAAILMLPGTAGAANVTVGCPGGTPGMFASVTDALNALPFNSPSEFDIITVTGTCTENLFISRRQGLIIEAPVGQTAIVNSADPAAIVVHIFQSRAIILSRLVIQGGQRGVLVNNGSDVTIVGSTIQDNLGVGGGRCCRGPNRFRALAEFQHDSEQRRGRARGWWELRGNCRWTFGRGSRSHQQQRPSGDHREEQWLSPKQWQPHR